jgi:hypothetical protein
MSEEIRKRDEAELRDQDGGSYAEVIQRSDNSEMTTQELDELSAENLPDRENMSLVNANVAIPVNAAVAANVLTNQSTATAGATQNAPINQANHH